MPESLLAKKRGVDIVERRMIILNKEIRQKGLKEGVFDKYKKTENNRNIAARKLTLFFNGLFEYVSYLLTKHCVDSSGVTLYTVGNAWKFLNALQDSLDGGLSNYIEKYIKEGLKASLNVTTTKLNKKGVVAEGALKSVIQNTYVLPKIGFPIKSIVGFDAKILVGDSEMEIKKEQEVPLEINIANRVQAEEKANIRFDIKYPQDGIFANKQQNVSFNEINQAFNSSAQDALYYKMNTSTWHLTKSLFAVFLEKIFPKYYLEIDQPITS